MRTVLFDGKDSFNYYSMLTLKGLSMSEPPVRIITEEIAGRDGSIDYTEAIAGCPIYDDRKGTFPFRIIGEDCKEKRDAFVSDVHGKKIPILISDETRSYIGRCDVETTADEGYYLDIKVNVYAEPFKLDGEVKSVTQQISGETTVTLVNDGDGATTPTITTDAEVTISYETWTYTVGAGTFNLPFVLSAKSDTVVTISGTANITISWIERYL